jgi:serine/threonine protein kinase
MEKGNLRHVLNNEYAIMSSLTKLGIVVDICDAMRFLHACKITHGTLCSENVLVDATGRAKLTGFGTATHYQPSKETSMTLQVSQYKKSGAKTMVSVFEPNQIEDIRCFGAILWELITGRRLPWTDLKSLNRNKGKLTLSAEETKFSLPILSVTMKKCLEIQSLGEVTFRCLFDSLHSIQVNEARYGCNQERRIPEGFICPITQDIMKEPVMLLDGHSYERAAIEAWLSKSDRSPLTNEILKDRTVLLENYALKAAIENFLRL